MWRPSRYARYKGNGGISASIIGQHRCHCGHAMVLVLGGLSLLKCKECILNIILMRDLNLAKSDLNWNSVRKEAQKSQLLMSEL